MLAPNPQAKRFTYRADKAKVAKSASFEKFIFVAALVVAYAVAVAALIYPVVMYVFW